MLLEVGRRRRRCRDLLLGSMLQPPLELVLQLPVLLLVLLLLLLPLLLLLSQLVLLQMLLSLLQLFLLLLSAGVLLLLLLVHLHGVKRSGLLTQVILRPLVRLGHGREATGLLLR